MTKNIKEQYVKLLDNQCILLGSIVSSLSPHAEKTQDRYERLVLGLLNDASRKVGEAATEARNIPETDS